jgi:hypothetical protein
MFINDWRKRVENLVVTWMTDQTSFYAMAEIEKEN